MGSAPAKMGTPLRVVVQGAPLPAGDAKVSVAATSSDIGKVKFDIKEKVQAKFIAERTRGLYLQANYVVEDYTDEVGSGLAWMRAGLDIYLADYGSVMLRIRQVE